MDLLYTYIGTCSNNKVFTGLSYKHSTILLWLPNLNAWTTHSKWLKCQNPQINMITSNDFCLFTCCSCTKNFFMVNLYTSFVNSYHWDTLALWLSQNMKYYFPVRLTWKYMSKHISLTPLCIVFQCVWLEHWPVLPTWQTNLQLLDMESPLDDRTHAKIFYFLKIHGWEFTLWCPYA